MYMGQLLALWHGMTVFGTADQKPACPVKERNYRGTNVYDEPG